ncbi:MULTISPECIES: TerL [unclassified Achromobacter]|uniref:TerL n=1 Tax=unclassified Achromobacter TaxID=2626865 RepID=UPI0011784D67|nr:MULTISPECIES: TerL [unclassified Achromobacter]
MKSDAFVRGIRGPLGSGKSTCCIFEILRRARMQKPAPNGKRKTRWVVIRNTYAELKTTTIKSWHQWIPQHIGRWQSEGPPTHYIDEGDLQMEVMFIALDRPDDIRKLLSLEVTGGWINEAREIPKAVLDALTGRVGRYPSMMDGGATWHGVLMDTNSPDSDHWWYRLAEEECPVEFEFFAQPGGRAENAENRKNLPAGYYERMVAGKDADWVKVYVDNEYGFVREGKPVYPDYIDALHCREFEIVRGWPILVGIDFGLTPAATFGQRSPMGQWRVHSELVTEDMGAVRFAELFKQVVAERYRGLPLASIAADPAGDGRAQTDERTPLQILKAAEIDAHGAPTNDPTLRIEAVSSSLRRLIDGQPGYLLHPQCKTLRKAKGGGYAYRRIQVSGAERYHDVPDKNKYSHVSDAEQYMFVDGGEHKIITQRTTNRPRNAVAISDYNIFGS